MSTLWIVHRDAHERAALLRLAAREGAVRGAPADAGFDAAPPAEIVLLGLAGLGRLEDDWEAELEFAHRHRARLVDARWILLGEADDRDAALALFDRGVAEFVPYPPSAAALRRRIRAAEQRPPPSLSRRARREAVAARFSRWLADLEIPELLRAMDPRLADVPLVVRGEPGTGRAALVRYVHEFGPTAEGLLAHLPCAPDTRLGEIGDALAPLAGRRDLPALCIWLDEVGRLAASVQRELREWMEAGPPPGVRVPRLRWVATQDERGADLDPGLTHALAKLVLRLPPLRERPERLDTIVEETARAWAAARREPVRRFDAEALAAMHEYPWPGNLRELEAVVQQTLATTRGDPICADDLRLEGLAPAPVDASEVGTLLSEEELEPEEMQAAAGAPGEGPGSAIPPPALPAAALSRAPTPAAAGPDTPLSPDGAALERLAAAISREMRDPLATIRSLAAAFSEHGDDPELRRRFAETLTADTRRIQDLLGRLSQLAALDAPVAQKLDVPALLEVLREERREAFRSRHLLVLKELDASRPFAHADPRHLRAAFEALLDTALALVPERGDVYLASRHHDGGVSGEPSVRVLLRFHDPAARTEEAPPERSLALLVAELLVRAQGGRFTLAASEGEERVIVVDLPAP